jgi:hypothetical protein
MRALVISDTHFGAWTGEDLLREPDALELLAPALDVDEVIFLGDMFDVMFASIRDSFEAARGLLELLRGKLQGKRFVFLAGNHDHHFVTRDAEDRLELALATGRPAPELSDELRRADLFRLFLEQHLEGVEVDIRYPTYTFAGVLCMHGHYLDLHASRSGGGSTKLLSRALWSIAVGGRERSPTIADYEATATLLTGLLYTIAQLPNGTGAQRRAFRTFQALGHAAHLSASPVRAAEKLVCPLGSERPGPPGGRSVRAGRREPRLVVGDRQHRVRPHPPATRWRARTRQEVPLLEHGVLDLRAGPSFKQRLRRLPQERLARYGRPHRLRRTGTAAAAAARTPQPTPRVGERPMSSNRPR